LVRRAATAARATAIRMFLARYAIAPCPLRSVDEVDHAGAEVRLAPRGLGREDPDPHDLRDPAGDAAGAAVLFVSRHVEPDPRDHVVLRVRARALDRAVDREEQLGVAGGSERVLAAAAVPLLRRSREVVAAREVDV